MKGTDRLSSSSSSSSYFSSSSSSPSSSSSSLSLKIQLQNCGLTADMDGSGCKSREIPIFWKKGKIVISITKFLFG